MVQFNDWCSSADTPLGNHLLRVMTGRPADSAVGMPTTSETIVAAITDAAATGFRGRLIARGQARAMIWRDGVLPPGAPAFSPQLSFDLHSYAYGLLGLGLRLVEMGGDPVQARIAFEHAATALEAVMARGNRLEADRHFHFVMVAAGYHLAHLSARAFSLLSVIAADENFSPIEQALSLLMRRDIAAFRAQVSAFRINGDGSDARIAVLIANAWSRMGWRQPRIATATTSCSRASISP